MTTQLATEVFGGIDLNGLAEELGAAIRPAVDIWNDYGIHTREAAARILGTPAFQQMYTEAKSRWESRANARTRIKAKAMVAIEQGLPELYEGACNPKQPLNHRVEVFKMLSKLAGIDAEVAAAQGAVGHGLSITIDLSSDGNPDRKITVIGAAHPATIDADAEEVETGDEDSPAEPDDDTLRRELYASLGEDDDALDPVEE